VRYDSITITTTTSQLKSFSMLCKMTEVVIIFSFSSLKIALFFVSTKLKEATLVGETSL